MKLVIVESPAKCKTIEKYLGEDYKVVSSKGHIRNLAPRGKYGLGIDIENNFEPTYEIITGKKRDVTALKKEAKLADTVYLATDPDREGENISYHLYEELNLTDVNSKRVVFNEITKDVVRNAIENPGKMDMDLVKSGETRKFLDRIIGFRLSNLMQRKTSGKSAGRVQSVALKLIVDREREIEAFIPEEYWTVEATFPEFKAVLDKYKNEDIEIKNEEQANTVLANLSEEFKIADIVKKLKNKKSNPVFKTSTMQQTAASKINFSPSKTMSVAQKLYEGIDIGTEITGLITYMRTDSIRVSDSFVGETYNYIENKYGKEYIGYVKTGKKDTNGQDAHEGIRPTSIKNTPESIKKYLSDDEYKLYSLIYFRSLASLMCDAKMNTTTIHLDNNDYLFKTSGSTLAFDGYLKVYAPYESQEDTILPNMDGIDTISSSEIEKIQHFTKPLPRFNESSLIKELESLGIGRPSTYATIIYTIKDRGYATLEDKRFTPTEVGIETTDKLQEYFSTIINVDYTAKMEEDLDKIAEAQIDNIKLLKEFYEKFEPLVDKAFAEMEKKAPEETGEVCPNCGSPMVKRSGRYGEFEACGNYPECKYIKKEEKEEKIIMPCPKCDGNVLEKTTRRGKIFYGCSCYPKCDFASWDFPIEEQCEKCNSNLVLIDNKKSCPVCDKVDKKKK
ncbi:MAG: type I DNA topoisomerase [bacterium]